MENYTVGVWEEKLVYKSVWSRPKIAVAVVLIKRDLSPRMLCRPLIGRFEEASGRVDGNPRLAPGDGARPANFSQLMLLHKLINYNLMKSVFKTTALIITN